MQHSLAHSTCKVALELAVRQFSLRCQDNLIYIPSASALSEYSFEFKVIQLQLQ